MCILVEIDRELHESDEEDEEDEELRSSDEEDEVVKAIIRSKDVKREHPPPISIEVTLGDICFHPIKDIIGLANLNGDVLL